MGDRGSVLDGTSSVGVTKPESPLLRLLTPGSTPAAIALGAKESDINLEYRLHEVSIKRALVVPDTDEGVETCPSMHPQSTSAVGSSDTWREFRIFSYTTSAGWAENCRGIVSIGTNQNDNQQLAAECQDEWADAHSPSSVSAIGLTYGPLFQGLKNITVNPRVPSRVAGVAEVTNTRSGNPKEFEHERLLHPATLDNFLQLALPALGGVGLKKLSNAIVPTKSNVVALDANTSQPVALLDGFKVVAIKSNDGSFVQERTIVKHCYKPAWEPDVELIDRANLDRVLQAAPRPDDRPKTVRELELLAYYFIDTVLQDVDKVEVDNMLPHHQLFYKDLVRLRHDVVCKIHPQQTEEWQQLRGPQMTFKLEVLAEHYRNHETAYDGKLLVRVGEALPAVFRQEVEPLTLMTHENMLEDYYTTAVCMPNTYAQITRYITMLSHKYPNLDFLETGAGTGGATVPTTEGLRGGEGHQARLKSYTYTDISSYFFERATEKFGDFADHELQEARSNVLHATSDMHRTMIHIRKLLRPGGKHILLEMTNRLLAASVIFGTLRGWWNATDGRTGGPLLTETQWQDVLHATGFGTLQASSPDVLDPLEEGTKLTICEAIEPKISLRNGRIAPPESPRVFVACAGSPVKMTRSTEAVALLEKMQASGIDIRMLPFNMLQKQDISDAIYISFVELDEPLLAGISSCIYQCIQGLARSLRAEHEEFRCITVDLDSKEKLLACEVTELLFRVYEEHLTCGKKAQLADSEFVEQDGLLHVKCAIEDVELNNFLIARTDVAALPPQLEKVFQMTRSLRLRLSDSRNHSSNVWEDNAATSQPLKRTEVEIEVQATSLDVTDVNIISGIITSHQPGRECSGVVTKIGSEAVHLSVGDCVVAWTRDTFSTHATAWYSLVHIARFTAGEKVLIQEAADPVGQAAIHIASTLGAEIYVTARSDEETAILSDKLRIPESQMFSSQNTNFISTLRRLTQGHGIDVILSTSAGETLQATFSCVAPFGRFVDLGKSNAQNNERLEMAPFARSVSFISIDMSFLYQKDIRLAGKIFQDAMNFVTEHELKTCQHLHLGIWSKLGRGRSWQKPWSRPTSPTPSVPRPNASYLLSDGLDGLGRSISQYLVTHGARNFISLSRSGASSASASSLINFLNNSNIRTTVLNCDVSDSSTLSTLLADTFKAFQSIKGVIQLAMSLNDSLFSNTTLQQWTNTIRPKVHGSKNLHELTLN
ncbi:KR-domain-containing protein [Ophiobolus disseminans]|uniref:KR-domain-containing protein n=1 Tax=Ophiobolus disseminans TaxID=1469910 RepID=A0A6A6ZXK2_9PLEO|nr:KR-domain-containing protein [Ophiobolus disseminans]